MSVGRNIIWSATEQILRVGVGFFVNILVARSLGPGDYGAFASSMAIAGILGNFVLLGLDLVTIREVSPNPSHTGEIIWTVFVLRLAVSFAILAGVFWWAGPGSLAAGGGSFQELVLILCLLLPFQAVGCTIGNCLVASLQSKLGTVSLFSALLITTLARIKGIRDGAGVEYFAWCYLFEFILAAILLVVLFRRYSRIELGRFSFSWERAGDLMKKAKWLLMSAIAVNLLQNTGILLMNLNGSQAEVGTYAAAARLVLALQFLPGLIGQSFVPMIAKLYEASHPRLEEYEEQLYRLLWLIGYGIAGFFLVSATFLVPFLLGRNFLDAAPIVRILAFSVIPFSLGAARMAIFSKTRNYRLILICDVSGALTTVVLSALLISLYGASGAAVAVTLGAVVAHVVLPLILARDASVSRRTLLRTAIFPFPNLRVLFSGRV